MRRIFLYFCAVISFSLPPLAFPQDDVIGTSGVSGSTGNETFPVDNRQSEDISRKLGKNGDSIIPKPMALKVYSRTLLNSFNSSEVTDAWKLDFQLSDEEFSNIKNILESYVENYIALESENFSDACNTFYELKSSNLPIQAKDQAFNKFRGTLGGSLALYNQSLSSIRKINNSVVKFIEDVVSSFQEDQTIYVIDFELKNRANGISDEEFFDSNCD